MPSSRLQRVQEIRRYRSSVDDADDEAIEFDDFVCTCDDERKAAAAALRADVIARLSSGSEELMARPVDASNLASAIVMSLNWDFNARVTQIAADQWFGIWAESYDGKFKTRIDCDTVEDGLAAT